MKTPILATIYRLFGFLGFIGGGLCIVLSIAEPSQLPGGIMIGLISIFAGVISLGIAEVITLIAKIEHNTSLSSNTGSEKIMGEVAGTLKALLLATKSTTDLPPIPGSEKFYIAIESSIEGPYPLNDIIELKEKGALDDTALCIQERGKEWKKISELNKA